MRGRFNDPFFVMRRQIIYDALDKYPDHGNLTLAKLIYSQHPEFFNDVEHVRNIIRVYRGVHGKKGLEDLTNRKYVKSVQPT